MIEIIISHNYFIYDAYHITKAFFPQEEIKTKVIENQVPGLDFIKDNIVIFSFIDKVYKTIPNEQDRDKRKNCKHNLNQQLYLELVGYTGINLTWGFMTGIRPTKITTSKYLEFKAQIEATSKADLDLVSNKTQEWLQAYYNVSPSKARIAVEIVQREQKALKAIDVVNGYSLYIGIPFCPSRCTYCSFTSYPLKEWEQKIEKYLEALIKELKFIGKVSRHKTLDTIYIGGGTPTTLSANQLDRLLLAIKEQFHWQQVKEITVEAGRPDSITLEKLQILKSHGVERISINPQTMQNKTLKLIGRNHSVEEIYQVYDMAQKLGFKNINMDLIMGLPEESIEDVNNTLEQIRELKPQSLTIHALAIKRSSILKDKSLGTKKVNNLDTELNPLHSKEQSIKIQRELELANNLETMINLANEMARELNLVPYYLYRQKNIAGNFENIGYCEEDKVSLYNILMMEEKQSVVAAGAGACTKIVLQQEKNNIIRIENVKNVDDYITRIDEMIDRKGEYLWH